VWVYQPVASAEACGRRSGAALARGRGAWNGRSSPPATTNAGQASSQPGAAVEPQQRARHRRDQRPSLALCRAPRHRHHSRRATGGQRYGRPERGTAQAAAGLDLLRGAGALRAYEQTSASRAGVAGGPAAAPPRRRSRGRRKHEGNARDRASSRHRRQSSLSGPGNSGSGHGRVDLALAPGGGRRFRSSGLNRAPLAPRPWTNNQRRRCRAWRSRARTRAGGGRREVKSVVIIVLLDAARLGCGAPVRREDKSPDLAVWGARKLTVALSVRDSAEHRACQFTAVPARGKPSPRA
jgi:hypothetical protein